MSVTMNKTGMKCFAGSLFFRSLAGPIALLILGSFGTSFGAQTIKIRLVNGRSGRAMTDKCIYVGAGDRSDPKSGSLLQTQTDGGGVVNLRLIEKGTEINTQGRPLACGLWGVINPVAKYGDTIYIRTGYVLCRPHTPDYSWLAMVNFSTKKVLESGVATANVCGKAKASAKPGEIILFVRPLSFWERLKE